MTSTDIDLSKHVQGLPAFTDEQLSTLVDYMVAAGKSRGRAQGAEFSEVDFLAGCMTTLFALGRQDALPGGWTRLQGGGHYNNNPEFCSLRCVRLWIRAIERREAEAKASVARASA